MPRHLPDLGSVEHNLVLVLAAVLGLGIAACVGALQPPCPVAPPAVICPPLRAWNAPDQHQALMEYQALPAGATLRQFLLDYESMRDSARACRGFASPAGTL